MEDRFNCVFMYSFLASLAAAPIIKRQMVGLLVTNKMEDMWKEATMA
jgi:hypothetical protein